MFPGFYGAISSKKGCSRVSVRKVLAGSGGWFQVLPSSFPGYINGRTLLYIGSIHSWTHHTWRARLVSPSDKLSPISSRPAHPSRPRSGIPILSERSSHVLPPMACAVAWDLWLRQSSSAMSCRHWHARVRASFATRRSSAQLHNLLKILSPLRGSSTASYILP